MTFAPGQVVTVFRSRLRPEALEEYGGTATRMNELAVAMPGYVDHKVFTAEDGERVTVVTFADRASHDACGLTSSTGVRSGAGGRRSTRPTRCRWPR